MLLRFVFDTVNKQCIITYNSIKAYKGHKMKKRTRIKKFPVILEPEEVHNLLQVPNIRYLTSLRNKAIMSLMVNCGLRVSEIVALKAGDINLTKGTLNIMAGKGDKDRFLGIPDNQIDLLKSWKKKRPESQYFFPTLKDRKGVVKFKNGTQRNIASKPGSQLSIRTIQFMIKRYAEKAGIKKKISPHTLRHSYATEFYRRTNDIEKLREILGHESVTTTQIYITLSNEDVKNGMKQFEGFV